MSYQKQNFANGEVLSASQLNHIEQGIVDVESAVNATKTAVDEIIDPTLSLSGKAADAKATGDAIQGVRDDLAAETARAQAAEKANADNIAAEAERAQAAESALSTKITEETERAKAAEQATSDALATKAVIDDTTVGTDAWSSKHIVDMLCPPLDEAGNPVQCYPVAGYPLGVVASWEPVQEGTGDPSPDNIRPIKGRDSVAVERCGENIIEFLSTNDSSSGIKIAVDAEKNITLNGTLVEKGNIDIGMCRLHWVAGKTYTMYIKKVGGSASLGSGDDITFSYSLFTTDYNSYFRGDTNGTNLGAYIARGVALVETELIFMLQCWRDGTVFNNFKFQIEVVEGAAAPTAYAPYTGQTATIALPRTIYGGTVDAVTGEGQETWKLVTLDGTENWHMGGAVKGNVSFFVPNAVTDTPIATASTEVCTHYKIVNYNNGTESAFLSYEPYAYINTRSFNSVEELKSYLAAQYAAGTPVQIAYKLAEPIPFTATGAQPIPALPKVNTLLTDADSVTVTGRADPIKRITDLEDAVASMTNT